MARKREVKNQIKPRVKQAGLDSRLRAAFIIAIIGIAFLIFNALYIFIAKDTFIKQLQTTDFSQFLGNLSAQESQDVISALPSALNTLAVLWVIIAAFAFYLSWRLKKKESRWWLLLILGIISLIVGRIEACVLLIVSSVLYKTPNKESTKQKR